MFNVTAIFQTIIAQFSQCSVLDFYFAFSMWFVFAIIAISVFTAFLQVGEYLHNKGIIQ
jgi:hypothetical protein